MSLYRAAADVPEVSVAMKVSGGELQTKQVFGLESSMMIARRSAGYHSKPHVHDAEQLNYVSEGQIWIYVENEAFLLKQGDFLRVPRLAVHWAWNKSDNDVVLIESHTPGLKMLPPEQTALLLSPSESAGSVRQVRNIWASEEYAREVAAGILLNDK